MRIKTKRSFHTFLFIIISFMAGSAYSRDVSAYLPEPEVAEAGMTLWQVILSGGEVMLLLALISIFAIGLIVYYFLTIKPENMLPAEFSDVVVDLVENDRTDEARVLCEARPGFLSEVYLAGLKHAGRDKYVIKEHIEDQARRSVDGVWQKLSYLSDVAAIAPMIGLLGTVLGMIQAFNVIAFQTGAVKPILLAGGISKAMVTTAAGLTIAVPALIFHSFFRSRAYEIERRVEDRVTEFWHLLSERGRPAEEPEAPAPKRKRKKKEK